jgi:hypothetical protein
MARTRKSRKGGADDEITPPPLTLSDLGMEESVNTVQAADSTTQNNNLMDYDDEPIMPEFNLSDLQVEHNPDEGLTDVEMDTDDEEMTGGRKTRRIRKKHHKKSKTRKHRKTTKKNQRKTIKRRKGRKTRHNKKITGGGYGTSCIQNDPNFSIYNTNELQLFPYRVTN